MFVLDSESIRRSKLTISLVISNILIYIFFLPFQDYIYYFIQINIAIFNNFEIWRLFTAMFIHGDLTHLL
ncbi:MAG: hypothetical protein ACFE9R_18510, partial [Candidatus Hermodarchaeota archaeon]